MFPRPEKLVFNFGVQIWFFLSSESIKLKLSAVPARNASGFIAVRQIKTISDITWVSIPQVAWVWGQFPGLPGFEVCLGSRSILRVALVRGQSPGLPRFEVSPQGCLGSRCACPRWSPPRFRCSRCSCCSCCSCWFRCKTDNYFFSCIYYYKTKIQRNVINRPGVAGAVLQTPPSMIHWFTD